MSKDKQYAVFNYPIQSAFTQLPRPQVGQDVRDAEGRVIGKVKDVFMDEITIEVEPGKFDQKKYVDQGISFGVKHAT